MIVFFIFVQILASIVMFISALVSEHILVENNFKNVERFVVCLFISWFSPYLITGALRGFAYDHFLRENIFYVLLASAIVFVCWQLVFYDLFDDLDDEGVEID